MKKVIAIIVIILGLSLVGFGLYSYFRSQKPNAGLKVDTTPPSLVFVDNVQIGQTPVEKIFKSGEVTIKLIPNTSATSLTTYQTKVRLTSGVFTVVRRDFNASDSESAGEIVTLEPQPDKVASLAVVTAGPDSASVLLDGQPQGFTPLLVASISPGDHQLTVTAPGFITRPISAKAIIGYKLSVNVKLAANPAPAPSEPDLATAISTPSASPAPKVTPKPTPKASPSATLQKPYVEIKDTPTGFLRVRLTPSTAASEISRVSPGDRFPLLNESAGWYYIKVDLDATASGWISSQYADKFE